MLYFRCIKNSAPLGVADVYTVVSIYPVVIGILIVVSTGNPIRYDLPVLAR